MVCINLSDAVFLSIPFSLRTDSRPGASRFLSRPVRNWRRFKLEQLFHSGNTPLTPARLQLPLRRTVNSLRPPRPTIKDVARAANVSQSTVSYILITRTHLNASANNQGNAYGSGPETGLQIQSLGRALQRGYSNQVTLLIVSWNWPPPRRDGHGNQPRGRRNVTSPLRPRRR